MNNRIAKCKTCSRSMRPRGTYAADWPNTVARGTTDTCNVCYDRRGGSAVAAADDTPCVWVKTDLRPSTYRALDVFAKANGTTVAVVLSRIADRAVAANRTPSPTPAPQRKPQPVQQPTRQPATRTDKRIAALNAEGWSDNRIAKDIGMAQSTVSKHRRELGLLSPSPRAARPGRSVDA